MYLIHGRKVFGNDDVIMHANSAWPKWVMLCGWKKRQAWLIPSVDARVGGR